MAKLTYENWYEYDEFVTDNATKGALDVLNWAYDLYNDELVYACSFGVEAIVMLDLISKVKRDAKVVFLDTGFHFQETFDLIDRVKSRYPELNIELKKPDLTVEEQNEKYGEQLWERRPDLCCHMRKVLPLEDVLDGTTAWLSGLRREQSFERRDTNFVNKDDRFKSVKVCPLIHWTWKEVWHYVRKNDLPYNILHDRGYPSIGCAPCTAPGDMETGSREGRWQDTNKTECGLHFRK